MDINQNLSTQNPPNVPVSPPTPPPVPPTPAPVTPPPVSPPPPMPTPPEPPKIPLQQPSEHNVGVGTPNIGVEEKQIPTHTPEPPQSASVIPPAPPKPETEITPPVEVENQDTSSQIEVANYGIPSADPPLKKPVDNPNAQPVQVKDYQNTPQPPVKASNFNTPLTVFIVSALILGSAGGFFGFRYLDQSKTAASTEATPTAATASPSLDVNTWQTYTSTAEKFSIKYPAGWFTNTTSESADSLIFAANEESLEGTPTSFKVEINFQNANGQTLKKWVEANTATTGEKKAAKEITVSEQTAYQQELSKTGSKVATYIERPSKIMVITYSAPEETFGSGGQWYNNFINSVKLM